MNDDMKRLCEAAADEMLNPRSSSVIESIVRVVLEELKKPGEGSLIAIADALNKPRQTVGHRGSSDLQAAFIAIQALIDHTLGESK